MLRKFLLLGACISALLDALAPTGAKLARSDEPDAPFELVDLQGKVQRPLEPRAGATVFFFVLPDCPVSNAYAPEIGRIATEYADRGVACFVVYGDPDLTREAAARHAKEYGFPFSVIAERGSDLAQRTGATMAPEAVVLGRDGKVHYRGRIDDLYADYGKRRVRPSQRDLRAALDAVLAGQPPPRERTVVIGCHLPRPPAPTSSASP